MPADLPPTDPEDAIADLKTKIRELENELATERTRNAERDGELTGLRSQLAALQPTPEKKKKIVGFFEVDDDE
jgi:ribosomal protein L29